MGRGAGRLQSMGSQRDRLSEHYLLITVFSREGNREGNGCYSGVSVNFLYISVGNMHRCSF